MIFVLQMLIKKILSLVLLLTAMAAAEASSNLYYGALRAEGAPNAGGRVYAGDELRTDTVAPAMTSPVVSAEGMGTEVVLYAYARPNAGWSFAGWSSAPDGAVARTDNPLAVSVSCRAKNENAPTTDTIFALFRELQSTLLTLETPRLLSGENGGGTYSAHFSDGTDFTVSSDARSHATGGTCTLQAQPDAGMKFFGWEQRRGGTADYISYSDTLRDYGFAEDCSVRAVFVSEDTPLWELKGRFGRYARLDEALARSSALGAAASVVSLVSSGTLHGSYEVPAGAMLLIPFDKQLSCYRESPVTVFVPDSLPAAATEEYIRLTMAPDASLTVRGELSVSSRMHAGSGSNRHGAGNPYGYYGRIHMQAGAQIVLQDSAKLYSWGFITGEGEISAPQGTRVYEGFHIPLYRGGNPTNTITGSRKHVFPINQYYIQNIEANLSIHYGADLRVHTAVTMEEPPKTYTAGAIYIGEEGLYRLAPGTVIRKHYDPAMDRQVYEIEGDAELAELQLNIGGYLMNSEVFVMPITNNMDIRLRSGKTIVRHQLAVLADASIRIDNGATLQLLDSTFVYDKDEWLLGKFDCLNYIQPATYSPTRQLLRDTAMMHDATLDVNGTLLVDSAFYTTKGGANICSSEGSGRIVFGHVSPAADTTWQALQDWIHITLKAIPCTAPKLRNAERYAGTEAAYLATGGLLPGDTVFAHQGHWGWLRSWEDEPQSNEQFENVPQSSSASTPDGLSYEHANKEFENYSASEEDTEYINHSYIYPSRSSERVVYAAVCALREEDLPELPLDTAHFIPERHNSQGEPCVFLGWTDAERDEANQQITVWATWDCPEEPEPSDAIEATEASADLRTRKILRDGRVVIIRDGREYDLLGRLMITDFNY